MEEGSKLQTRSDANIAGVPVYTLLPVCWKRGMLGTPDCIEGEGDDDADMSGDSLDCLILGVADRVKAS